MRTLGRLDVVVNNAGVMLLGPALDAPLEEWERMVQLNLTGLLYISHAAMPYLMDAAGHEPRRVADMVNISSVAGRVARSGSAVYNATKWGVNAFSEALRQEVTGRHVRVGLIEPGAVATELSSHIRPEIRDTFVERFAGVERLQAEDIARAITYMITQPRHAGGQRDPPYGRRNRRADNRLAAPRCPDGAVPLGSSQSPGDGRLSGGLLYVRTSDGEVRGEHHDGYREHHRGRAVAEADPTEVAAC